jgi:small-conductance mechanosensitive channel
MFGLEEACFRKTENGWLFFPWGVMGRGYQVGDEKKAELATFIGRFYLAVFAIIIGGGLFLTWWATIGLALLLVGYWFFAINRKLAGLSPTGERLTYSQSQQAMATGMPNFMIYIFLVCGILMTAGSLLAIFLALREGALSTLMGLMGFVFFGACLLMAINLLRLKRRSAGKPQSS